MSTDRHLHLLSCCASAYIVEYTGKFRMQEDTSHLYSIDTCAPICLYHLSCKACGVMSLSQKGVCLCRYLHINSIQRSQSKSQLVRKWEHCAHISCWHACLLCSSLHALQLQFLGASLHVFLASLDCTFCVYLRIPCKCTLGSQCVPVFLRQCS